jgi:prophage regulatory protein
VTEPRPVEYLTIADVAAELNVNVSQVRTLLRIGSLPATRNRRGHWLIERQMLERWVQDRYAETRRWVLEHDHDGYHGEWRDWPIGRVDDRSTTHHMMRTTPKPASTPAQNAWLFGVQGPRGGV